MTVTSEEKVLDAILVWCMQASHICGWAMVDELLGSSAPEQLFGERLPSIDMLLPLVHFPLMPLHLLQKVYFVDYACKDESASLKEHSCLILMALALHKYS